MTEKIFYLVEVHNLFSLIVHNTPGPDCQSLSPSLAELEHVVNSVTCPYRVGSHPAIWGAQEYVNLYLVKDPVDCQACSQRLFEYGLNHVLSL